MSDVAIHCEGLGKQYRIGRRERYRSLRDTLAGAVKSPLRRARAAAEGADGGQKTIWALDDVSFTVRHGDVVGVIGRNGAGKSTLLKVLSRITEPTRGWVKINGRVGSLLEVGTGFHPELTGRENTYLYGAILGMRRAEINRKFDEIVAFAEVERFIDTPVKHYSSGMYTRLAFSVAAHLEPEILLVDEVLAVGDVRFQKKCLGKMGEVARDGRTVLFVSHNMNAVEELCRSAMLLEQGRVHKAGRDVRQIINSYMFGCEGAPRASEWVNPGGQLMNPWFHPLRFVLTDEQGRLLAAPARNDEQMWVQIEGAVEQLDPAMNVGYALSAEDGRLLYWSVSTDGPESSWPVYRPGKCVLRSRIPSRFLNEGDYRLEMIVSLHHRAWLAQPGVNAPSVLLTIRGGLSDSPYWMTRRPGLIGPSFPWFLETQ